jgi:hypothetical protein
MHQTVGRPPCNVGITPSVVCVSEQRMSPKADCRIVRRCGLAGEGDLACANARIMRTHVTDGRTDRHCSVTHCADSCHVID